MRERMPWLLGIVVVAAVTATLGIVMLRVAAELQAQVYDFYTTSPVELGEAEYRYWDAISTNAYTLTTVAMPMLLVSLAAVFTLLAVIALLSERGQAEATPAS